MPVGAVGSGPEGHACGADATRPQRAGGAHRRGAVATMSRDRPHHEVVRRQRSVRSVARDPAPLGIEIAPLAGAPSIPVEIVAQFLDPAGHPTALTVLAGRALQAGQLDAAQALADRRCRVGPLPTALDFLLRAQIARHRGDAAGFARDLRRAVEIDPTNPLINLSALAAEDSAERLRAARNLVGDASASVEALRAAIACLVAHDEPIVAHLTDRDAVLRGWVTWPEGEDLVIRLASENGTATYRPRPDPRHRYLARGRAAADLSLPRPDPGAMSVHFAAGGGPGHLGWSVTLEPRRAGPRRPALDRAVGAADLTVIVPVYEDADATRDCLDSLRKQVLPGLHWDTVVVDDASPNPTIVADLVERARSNDITLISNKVNLGFAAAVNLAAETARGDILLLNADTVLPPGALARLVEAASATPRAGTVTPLSNNGEDTSFPKSFSFNDLPAEAELCAWDRAAQEAGGAPIDQPNAIVFCMRIKRDCWRALGGLSRSYGRGYFEDVDLCLRARDHGYRNLCATNVIVGHAGSRSFQASKRALVVRNLAALSLRFPDYQAESAAFLKADPLRPVFAEIERRIAPPRHDVLLVAPAPGTALAVRFRQDELRRLGKRCLILKVPEAAAEWRVSLQSLDGGIPQSVTFAIHQASERAALLDYLQGTEIQSVEWMDPGLSADVVLDLLDALGCPIHLHLSEALSPPSVPRDTAFRDARVRRRANAAGHADPGSHAAAEKAGRRGWIGLGRTDVARRLLARVDGVICSDAMALAHARRLLGPDWPITRAGRPGRAEKLGQSLTQPEAAPRGGRRILGILSPVANTEVTELVLALSRHLGDERGGTRLCVIGATLNDLTLMARGNVFVTGAAPPADLAELASIHRPEAMVLPYRGSAFHALELAREGFSGAWAYYDWSGGGHACEDGDLALPPDLDAGAAAERILHWFGQNPDRQS